MNQSTINELDEMIRKAPVSLKENKTLHFLIHKNAYSFAKDAGIIPIIGGENIQVEEKGGNLFYKGILIKPDEGKTLTLTVDDNYDLENNKT